MNATKNTVSNVNKKLLAFVAMGLLALPAAWSAKTAGAPTEQKLIVNVEDLRGQFDIRIEDVREDLLEMAFYDSVARTDWKGKTEFRYNEGTPKDARGVLELNVINWRRSPANFYEFTMSATYYDQDGKAVRLGTFHGTRSGISVFTRYDVGEEFAGSAEDAIKQAFKKLDEVVS